jgi:hypothetical protein
MSARVLSVLLGLALVLALPDLARTVEELGARVAALEERVAKLETSTPVASRRAEPLDPARRRDAVLDDLAARLGFEPDELAGLEPGARAWAIEVREAALQAWLLATQVAGNEGLLRPEQRLAMAEAGHRREAGRRLAARVVAGDDPPRAFRALEEGVRELLAGWLRDAGRSAGEEPLERLLSAWRAASIVIVRESLDRGARWRAELEVPAAR